MTYSDAYLGCLMEEPGLIQADVPVGALAPELQALYQKMGERIISGEPVDPMSLTLAFSKEKWWPGAVRVSEMPRLSVSKVMVKTYASELKKAYRLSKIQDWHLEAKRVVDEAKDPDEAIAELEQGLAGMCERQTSMVVPLGKVIEEFSETDGDIPCIKTGDWTLDEKWLLDKGGHHVVAARPGMGKTAFACWLMTELLKRGLKVLFFSLEMPRFQIVKRLKNIWGDLSGHENDPMIVCDVPALTMESLSMLAQANRSRVDIIFVDYLQLIKTRTKHQSREQMVSWVSASLKELARRMDCPVVTLCQLNREAESTSDHRPMLSHLRESGSIEQDADSVSFIYRPEYYLKNQRKEVPENQMGLVEFTIAKQRNRDTAILKCHFDRTSGVWSEWRDSHTPTFAGRMFTPMFTEEIEQ